MSLPMGSAANLLTALRALLLPIPLWMLYQRTPAWGWAALAAFALVGLTDVADGMAARRFGSNALGRVLDGLVDRLFLVAVYIPFADLGIVPLAAVALLLGRELLMRELRGLLADRGIAESAGFLGKLKTTSAFAGGGLILLIHLLGDDPRAPWILAAFPLAALVLLVVARLRGRRPGAWAAWGPVGFGLAWLARLLLGPAAAVTLLMAGIVGVALLAAAVALRASWRELAAIAREQPLAVVRCLVVGAVLPAVACSLVGRSPLMTLAAGITIGAELTLAGILNALPPADRPRSGGARLLRLVVVTLAIGSLLFLATGAVATGPLAPLSRMVVPLGSALIAAELLGVALQFRPLARALPGAAG